MTDDQCNKFLTLLMKDTQSPSFVCPECEYIDWSPIDHLANPLPVVRWMEKEMPEVLDNYLQYIWVECRENSFIRTLDKSIDLRNLVRWLIEHPTWGEEICTENNRPLDCCQNRDECRLQVKIPDGKSCLGKIIHPALQWAIVGKEEEK